MIKLPTKRQLGVFKDSYQNKKKKVYSLTLIKFSDLFCKR